MLSVTNLVAVVLENIVVNLTMAMSHCINVTFENGMSIIQAVSTKRGSFHTQHIFVQVVENCDA